MTAQRLGELLRAGAARLEHAGVPGAARDARALLAHSLGLAPDRLSLMHADPVPEDAARRFDAALAARVAGRPVSRILGRRAFWRHEFRVTDAVLDPRPETETLVARALDAPVERVLDLGTGSGCILLSVLADRPQATGLGTDLSDAALSVARDNAKRLGLDTRASFLCADWFAGVTGRFDTILSNPPYIAAQEMPGLAPEVRDHDPRGALTPGGDGLEPYRLIAAGASAHLSPGGRLLVEIGATQGAEVAAIFGAAGLLQVTVYPDLDGRDRVVAARCDVRADSRPDAE
ncbi:peptide chain release factor N(5)-glutamine methyltransferase [Mesobaculum littorinae]|uniref:Release factor glutamine methyltransferase n=1 Tax=Mesobaculum littorinae TaxID=2486419 RepID=A0A438AJU4_9RHOB|nr:peptide chain release factor N(5)-glutamine methyltransferase [Mesobaculum littorinae]RVV98929.1 peptide chain release factor N(5)-glutamine methyltransferase [Mesobaculum littorinae]